MKRLLIIAIVVTLGAGAVGLGSPSQADAAMKKWFWTEQKAEKRVKYRFSDVRSADCIGFGYNWRYNRYGQEVYTAFYCSGSLTDGSEYQITIYTTGKYRFKWYRY
jgi:hypothetical protein